MACIRQEEVFGDAHRSCVRRSGSGVPWSVGSSCGCAVARDAEPATNARASAGADASAVDVRAFGLRNGAGATAAVATAGRARPGDAEPVPECGVYRRGGGAGGCAETHSGKLT